jgi:hypothetical protein
MVMIFQNEYARRQLLSTGAVATFRHNKHKEGKDWATDHRCGKKLCDIHIILIGTTQSISEFYELLNSWAHTSGFKDRAAWIMALREKYHGDYYRGYLFYVRRI